jgi:hypothetical protein
LRWWSVADLLANEEVHLHTKQYFLRSAEDGFRCAAFGSLPGGE